MEILIPIVAIIGGISVPLATFFWLYHESKNKNETILEISKNLDDPSKLERLLGIFDESFKIIGAGGLSILMIAAFITHLKVKNPIYKTLPSITLLSFSVIILLSSFM